MAAEILDFTGVTRLDVDPDRVLQKALGEVDGCVVVGFDKEGGLFFASSYADGGTVLWLFELAKKRLLEIGNGDYDG